MESSSRIANTAFADEKAHQISQETSREREEIAKYRFLDYASHHWGSHFHRAQTNASSEGMAFRASYGKMYAGLMIDDFRYTVEGGVGGVINSHVWGGKQELVWMQRSIVDIRKKPCSAESKVDYRSNMELDHREKRAAYSSGQPS